jgi:hypothetical protein
VESIHAPDLRIRFFLSFLIGRLFSGWEIIFPPISITMVVNENGEKNCLYTVADFQIGAPA